MENFVMLIIEPIHAFSDNYIWLVYDDESRNAFVVDPGDAQPVESKLEELALNLEGVLITHHHFDHVGGLAELSAGRDLVIYGPHNPAIEAITHRLAGGDTIVALGEEFAVTEVPGHTLDHIAYFNNGDQPVLFCGDTLFAGGCGRMFEGTAPMMLNSLEALAALPTNTKVYCAHEYTLANLAFAQAVEPDNAALAERVKHAVATREQGQPTVPSNIGLELATNPFLRCTEPSVAATMKENGMLAGSEPAEVFAAVRGWKDNF
ncbi:MAG: hydroxyacylglutathione hydrolase [Halioglobus sp.]